MYSATIRRACVENMTPSGLLGFEGLRFISGWFWIEFGPKVVKKRVGCTYDGDCAFIG